MEKGSSRFPILVGWQRGGRNSVRRGRLMSNKSIYCEHPRTQTTCQKSCCPSLCEGMKPLVGRLRGIFRNLGRSACTARVAQAVPYSSVRQRQRAVGIRVPDRKSVV